MTTSKEEWRPIPGHEGLYEVSNHGNIKSLDRVITKSNGVSARYRGKEISKVKMPNGYLNVVIGSGNDRKMFGVHRLVAMAFIKNNENKPQVNHINEIKHDNRPENLEWVTSKENINHGTARSRIAKTQTNDHRSTPVLQSKINGTPIKVWPSIGECGRFGFDKSLVSMCCRGIRKTHKNYNWKFI